MYGNEELLFIGKIAVILEIILLVHYIYTMKKNKKTFSEIFGKIILWTGIIAFFNGEYFEMIKINHMTAHIEGEKPQITPTELIFALIFLILPIVINIVIIKKEKRNNNNLAKKEGN